MMNDVGRLSKASVSMEGRGGAITQVGLSPLVAPPPETDQKLSSFPLLSVIVCLKLKKKLLRKCFEK